MMVRRLRHQLRSAGSSLGHLEGHSDDVSLFFRDGYSSCGSGRRLGWALLWEGVAKLLLMDSIS